MSLNPSYHIQTRRGNNVRIGPISIITLITVICLAVLAVLAASTSHASATIAERQAEGNRMMYANECAGQEFVAGVDAVLAGARVTGTSGGEAARMVENRLDGICEDARNAASERVSCVANVEGTEVTAEFVCEDTRRLIIAITIRDDATYRIDKWKATSVQQTPQSAGNLWTGA